MLTRTTECGIQALQYLAHRADAAPVARHELAAALDLSSTYLAKIVSALTRAGILRSSRGASGGVLLARAPAAITLLQILEACQGPVRPQHCGAKSPPRGGVCPFHRAMEQMHVALTQVLGAWTLADLAAGGCHSDEDRLPGACRVMNVARARRAALDQRAPVKPPRPCARAVKRPNPKGLR